VRVGRHHRRRAERDPSARLRAILALPDSPEALPALLAAVDDQSPEVAKAALARLPRFAGPADAAYLRERLLAVDLAVVREWAGALRELGDGVSVVTAIRGLRAPRVATRMAAAIALGELRDTRAVKPLIGALEDPVAGVRRSALGSLAMLGPDPDAEHGCQRLLTDRDPVVRVAAVNAVCAIAIDADERLRPALKDPTTQVRRELANHAASLRANTVESLLRDAQPDVRSAAAWSLTRIPRPDTLEHLAALLCDDAWQVRRAGCRAVAVAGGREAIDLLLPRLADPHPTVSGAALNMLEDICGDNFASVIGHALQTVDHHLRRALVYALERCPPHAALPVLSGQVGDANADVRIAVAYVLGEGGSEPAAGLLRVMLADHDRAVRHAAESALQRVPRGSP
jgi:HEAT repeat protein